MKPYISVITLGVRDLPRARHFYIEGLGWPAYQDYEHWVAVQLGGGAQGLGLMPIDALAADAGVAATNSSGSGNGCLTLSYLVRTDERVAEVMAEAEKAGATIVKPAETAQWGGCSGTFADPDGFVWKVASGTGEQPYAE